MNTKIYMLVIALVILGFGVGLWTGIEAGYTKAEAQIQDTQQLAAEVATNEAVNDANPFQPVNPVEGIEANPFEKTKNILNPF